MPKAGFFPQIGADLRHGGRQFSENSARRPGEQVGHLERRANGVGGLLDPGLGLGDVVDGQDAERDRHPGLDPGELQPDAHSAAT